MDMPLGNELHLEVHRLNTISAELGLYRKSIVDEGMSREYAVALEAYHPGILNGTSVNGYTTMPSATRRNVALESIDWVRAGVVASLLITIASALYSFYKWIQGKVKDYLDTRVQDRINKIKGAAQKFDNAAASARPVEPPASPAVDTHVRQSQNTVYDKIVHRNAHVLNPILIAMANQAKKDGIQDSVLEAAARELEMLYNRLGDRYVALYTILALDRNARIFSGLLHVCDVTNSTKRERLYDNLDIIGVNDAVNSVGLVVSGIRGLTKRLKAKDIRGVPTNMQTLESRLTEAVETINDSPTTSGVIVKVVAPEGFYTTNKNDETIRHPSAYKIENTPRILDIYAEMDKWRNTRYSIWNVGGDIISPVTMSRWFEEFINVSTFKKIEDQINGAVIGFNNTLTKFHKQATESQKDIDQVRRDLESIKKEPFMQQPFEYQTPYLTGASGTYTSTPLEQLQRALMFVEGVNRLTVSQITNYIQLDNTLRLAVEGVTDGAGKYGELIKNA